MFVNHAYPADANAHSSLTKLLKFFSAAIIVVDLYIGYQVTSHIYQYVTTVHREPDLILIIGLLFLFVIGFKLSVCLYGYHFASNHTERTFENWHGLLSILNVTSVFHALKTTSIYYFLNYHKQAYKSKFEIEIEDELASHIGQVQAILVYQLAAHLLYHFLWSRLSTSEA